MKIERSIATNKPLEVVGRGSFHIANVRQIALVNWVDFDGKFASFLVENNAVQHHRWHKSILSYKYRLGVPTSYVFVVAVG